MPLYTDALGAIYPGEFTDVPLENMATASAQTTSIAINLEYVSGDTQLEGSKAGTLYQDFPDTPKGKLLRSVFYNRDGELLTQSDYA